MTPYAELHAASAFSFLEGASQPEELVSRAVELGLPAVALVDRNGVYGAPRFWKAARSAGIKPLVGAEIVLDESAEALNSGERERRGSPSPPLSGPLGLVPDPPPPGTPLPRLTLLAADRGGYRNLCRLLTGSLCGPALASLARSSIGSVLERSHYDYEANYYLHYYGYEEDGESIGALTGNEKTSPTRRQRWLGHSCRPHRCFTAFEAVRKDSPAVEVHRHATT